MNILTTHYGGYWDGISNRKERANFPVNKVPLRITASTGFEDAIFIKTIEDEFVEIAGKKFRKISKGWRGQVSNFEINNNKVFFDVNGVCDESIISLDELNNYQRLNWGWYEEEEGSFFFSQSEKKIYKILKERNILFTVNSTIIFGKKEERLIPDFFIYQNKKLGILEVMGDEYHPSSTAPKDHSRARLFEDYGISCIQFYDAKDCYNDPEKIVDDFLRRLSASN